MPKPSLKDLRTAYRVLSHLEADVPPTLLVHLADLIKGEERSRQYRKLARMTEEDLIRYQATPRRRLRINLPDGRILQERTNELTFYAALRLLDPLRVMALGMQHRGQPLFVLFDGPRRQLTGHKYLSDGWFVVRNLRSEQRLELLRQLDQHLHLAWDILLI